MPCITHPNFLLLELGPPFFFALSLSCFLFFRTLEPHVLRIPKCVLFLLFLLLCLTLEFQDCKTPKPSLFFSLTLWDFEILEYQSVPLLVSLWFWNSEPCSPEILCFLIGAPRSQNSIILGSLFILFVPSLEFWNSKSSEVILLLTFVTSESQNLEPIFESLCVFHVVYLLVGHCCHHVIAFSCFLSPSSSRLVFYFLVLVFSFFMFLVFVV